MTAIQIIGSIWAFVAVCALLFSHGAHRKSDTYVQRKTEWEEV
jgi:hypothetical protein